MSGRPRRADHGRHDDQAQFLALDHVPDVIEGKTVWFDVVDAAAVSAGSVETWANDFGERVLGFAPKDGALRSPVALGRPNAAGRDRTGGRRSDKAFAHPTRGTENRHLTARDARIPRPDHRFAVHCVHLDLERRLPLLLPANGLVLGAMRCALGLSTTHRHSQALPISALISREISMKSQLAKQWTTDPPPMRGVIDKERWPSLTCAGQEQIQPSRVRLACF
jgi:hypothetical protein